MGRSALTRRIIPLMLATVAALVLTPVVYGLNPGFSHTYAIRIGFHGFLPLLGGNEGQVQVDMALDVKGLPSDSADSQRASSDISGFKLQFNGTEFPLDLQSVKGYFPKTTISLTPQGKVIKSDAPDIKLPVRLPGLDVKRFPDVTFLPIEFPTEGVELGTSWTYTKSFGDSDVSYTVTPSEITGETLKLDVEIAQSYQVLEDSAFGVVQAESDAESRVTTKLTGQGVVVFDRKLGVIRSQEVDVLAQSDVTNLKDKSVSHRKLATRVTVDFDKIADRSGSGSLGARGPLQLLSDKLQKRLPLQSALVAAQLVHPGNRDGRTAAPLLRAAVNQIYVPGKAAAGRQIQHLSILAGNAAVRIPELLDKNTVEHLGGVIGGFTAVAGEHWGPNYERLHRLGHQFVQNLFSNYSRPTKASRQRR